MKLAIIKPAFYLQMTAAALFACSAHADNRLAPVDSARIFISGHSLTYKPLGETVGKIAESLDKDYAYNQHLVGGSPIRVRTIGMDWKATNWPGYRIGENRDGENLDVVSELKSPKTLGKNEKYDTLVITERHDLINTIIWEDTVQLLRHYHDRLIDGNPNGHTLFYQSWLDINKKDPSIWIDHTQKDLYAWECSANKVNLTLSAEGRKDRVDTLPTGAALVELVKRVLNNEVKGIKGSTEEKLNRIFQDNVHMTQIGFYYISLVTYSAVYQSSPIGADIPRGIDDDTGEALQTIAWNFIKEYYSAPNAGQHSMEECRAYIAEKVCPSFGLIKEEPHKVAGCQANFRDPNAERNPYRWPDPKFKFYPRP